MAMRATSAQASAKGQTLIFFSISPTVTLMQGSLQVTSLPTNSLMTVLSLKARTWPHHRDMHNVSRDDNGLNLDQS